MELEKVKIKTSPTATILTAFGWFFYPVMFNRICPDQATWYFFLTAHILYCFLTLLAGIRMLHNSITRESLGPYVVNCEGHILFPGIEVYETEFINDKSKRRYGILKYSGLDENWFVAWCDDTYTFQITNPEYLRYEPYDNENRYTQVLLVGKEMTASSTPPPIPLNKKMQSDELH